MRISGANRNIQYVTKKIQKKMVKSTQAFIEKSLYCQGSKSVFLLYL